MHVRCSNMAAHCSVCVCVCVCMLGWMKCRAQIPSMGHHTWPHWLYILWTGAGFVCGVCTGHQEYIRDRWPGQSFAELDGRFSQWPHLCITSSSEETGRLVTSVMDICNVIQIQSSYSTSQMFFLFSSFRKMLKLFKTHNRVPKYDQETPTSDLPWLFSVFFKFHFFLLKNLNEKWFYFMS